MVQWSGQKKSARITIGRTRARYGKRDYHGSRFPWSFSVVDDVIGRLLQEDQDLRWSIIIGAYRDGDINLGKAAELLGLHELALRERLVELGIPVHIGVSDLAEAKAETDAILSWFNAVP